MSLSMSQTGIISEPSETLGEDWSEIIILYHSESEFGTNRECPAAENLSKENRNKNERKKTLPWP